MKEMILALATYFDMFKLPVKNEKGQGLVEYSLIIALVSVVSIAALLVMGPTVAAVFTYISTQLTV